MLIGKGQRKNLFWISAVVLVSLSYFYQVPQNPPGFYLDESSISYNAFTISQTGQDEYGTKWPLYFRAFGEYKNPVYIYLLSILFWVFGPSIAIARVLSASLGVATIVLLGLLAFRITKRVSVASLVALSASLTPWLFENSRLVFEVALYPTLLLTFLIVVYRASQQQQWRFLDSASLAITLALLTYSYSIGRLFAPLLALGLLFFVSKKRLPGLLVAWGIYVLSLLPAVVFHFRNPAALMDRFWLLTYIGPQKTVPETATEFLRHYATNINPWTIAVTGEINVRDHLGSMGSILAPSLMLAITGIVLVVLRHRSSDWWRFMLFTLVVSPIPASLTTTEFPQIRLVALPVLLHVFMIPAILWLLDMRGETFWTSHTLSRTVLALMLAVVITQGLIYRIEFRTEGPKRWYVFDEQFPREVLPTALAQNKGSIYFFDPPGKSGYVQAYWYGVLKGISANNFIRLQSEEKPPNGAVVISTEEQCSDCRLLLKSINYIVYLSGTAEVGK